MPRRRSNRNKYLLITMILVVAVVIAAFALSQPNTNSKRPSANDYFVVTHTTSTGEFSSQNKTITIATLGLNITAVGGDATDVYIRCASQASPMDDYLTTLKKGPPGWDLPVVLKGGEYNYHGLTLTLNDQGKFSTKVTVACNEVEAGAITVMINPEDIINVPAVP